MKVLIINTSPRKSFSTSKYLSSTLKFWLTGNKVDNITLKTITDYKKIIDKLHEIDQLVIATPVYVDSIPSTVLEYLKMLEIYVKEKSLKFDVYGLVNCGFYEGKQTSSALKTLEFWSNRSGLNWCGGLGCGAGVMIGFIRTLPLCGFIIEAIIVSIICIVGIGQGESYYSEFFSHYWYPSLVIQVGLWFLWSLGFFINSFKLSISMRKSRNHGIKFTTTWFCPKWLFVSIASIFWVLWAIILNFKWPWQLFKKDTTDTTISNIQ
ncbi:MAG: hypothetical protein ACRC4L_03800 [Mycoplasma sp.]